MEFLKNFRLAKGLKREDMARKMNISVSLYDKIEFDARTPSRNFLSRFKRAFPDFDMNIFFSNSCKRN